MARITLAYALVLAAFVVLVDSGTLSNVVLTLNRIPLLDKAVHFVMFGLLGSGDNASIVLALVVGLVLHGAMYGPQAAFITELFPTRIRYSGVSLAYQLTSIVAGSLAPIIALSLYKGYGSALPVAIYVGAACLISGVSALLAKETRGVELDAIR